VGSQDTITYPSPGFEFVSAIMDQKVSDREHVESISDGRTVPACQPSDRFWPYADLPEEPAPEELAALDPDLRRALFGAAPSPFSLTVVFPPFEGPDYARAVDMARASAEYRETGTGAALRHRARYWPRDATKLRDLWEMVGRLDASEVLVDDRPVPYARELWLPLVWFLIP